MSMLLPPPCTVIYRLKRASTTHTRSQPLMFYLLTGHRVLCQELPALAVRGRRRDAAGAERTHSQRGGSVRRHRRPGGCQREVPRGTVSCLDYVFVCVGV